MSALVVGGGGGVGGGSVGGGSVVVDNMKGKTKRMNRFGGVV